MELEHIRRVAWLARIAADDDELEGWRDHFGRLLDFVDVLKSVDTEGVEPMAHPLDAVQPLREDRVTESDCRDEVMDISPESEDGLFLVPKVIE
jgi:aspartyl-tRNA(Asn)/glutamyl-tRNA(Gln) amidotransferase subunit C